MKPDVQRPSDAYNSNTGTAGFNVSHVSYRSLMRVNRQERRMTTGGIRRALTLLMNLKKREVLCAGLIR